MNHSHTMSFVNRIIRGSFHTLNNTISRVLGLILFKRVQLSFRVIEFRAWHVRLTHPFDLKGEHCVLYAHISKGL